MKKFAIILCLLLSGCSSYLTKTEHDAITYPQGNPPEFKEYTDAGWVFWAAYLREHFDERLRRLESQHNPAQPCTAHQW
jgi:uncharacterized protein YceK